MRRLALAGLLVLCASGVGAEDVLDSVRDSSGTVGSLAAPDGVNSLARIFLSWHYLVEWTQAGGDTAAAEEASTRWCASRTLLLEDEEFVPLLRSGACLYEGQKDERPPLAELCDSLTAGRWSPAFHLAEGFLIAALLEREGRSVCGEEVDPAALLSSLVSKRSWSFEDLKDDADFSSLYFAAQRETQRLETARHAALAAFLDRPGLLVTLQYGKRRLVEKVSSSPPNVLAEGHLLYANGLAFSWSDAVSISVRDLPVLHSPAEGLVRFVAEDGEFKMLRDGEEVASEWGQFRLDGSFVFLFAKARIRMEGGRYDLQDSELKLRLPDRFWADNRRGFLMSAVIAVVTIYLLADARRKRRALREAPPRRPGKA